ncbi:hypothetical protein AB0M97_25375 [Streptomyces sp. NPDC051207]|uniref:hypothetical protein n=1 Tax=Streptomyces sp. NPDC051207 TaxID=3154641 RepID=UPI003417305F
MSATAVEQAGAVAGEARQQAGTALRDLQDRMREEADSQVQRLSGTLRQWADDLAGLAQNAPGDSPVRGVVAQASDGGHRAADYLDKNGVGGALTDVQAFARRRPGAFLGGAALAGLVVGRIAKAGKKGAQPSSGTHAQTHQSDEADEAASQSLGEVAPRPQLPPHPGV